MASVNKVILLGNLGRDPETRTFPNGDQVTNATIATTEKWKDKTSGETREATEWHRLVFTGGLAKVAADYLKKGSPVYVEGSIKTRKYQDKDGTEKYAVEIRVLNMQLLGSKDSGGGQQQQQQRAAAPAQRQAPAQQRGGYDDQSDDIPF